MNEDSRRTIVEGSNSARMPMRMPVMHIRCMRVHVHEPLVSVLVHVRSARIDAGWVIVLVMVVVIVGVGVDHLLLHVCMRVPFDQMEHKPKGHERTGDDGGWPNVLVEHPPRDSDTQERRDRPCVGKGARGT